MNNQFNNRRYDISIMQNISYIVTRCNVMPIFGNDYVVIGQPSSMWLGDRVFV